MLLMAQRDSLSPDRDSDDVGPPPQTAGASQLLRVSSTSVCPTPSRHRSSVPIPSAVRRGTIQVAREVLMRRLTRVGGDGRLSIFGRAAHTVEDIFEDLKRHIAEVNHLLACYRQLLQLIGNPQLDNAGLRPELLSVRTQCLRVCDTARNCVIPQLKSCEVNGGNNGPQHSLDFTKQANQFIGCLNLFIADMKRCRLLLESFPTPTSSIPGVSSGQSQSQPQNVPEIVMTISDSEESNQLVSKSPAVASATRNTPPTIAVTSLCTASSATAEQHTSSQILRRKNFAQKSSPKPSDITNLQRDIVETEAMLESIENAITVHFSTEHLGADKLDARPKHRRKSKRQMGNFCLACRTDYA